MSRVGGRRAQVAWIRSIVLQQIEISSFEEFLEASLVLSSPLAAEAGRIAENGSARPTGLRMDDVVLLVDLPTAEERIAPNLDAARVRVLNVFPDLGDVDGARVLHVQIAAEGVDDHLEADVGALVDRGAEQRPLRVSHMHHQWIFSRPRR